MSASNRDAALDYHRQPRPGKIAVTPTKALTNQQDLSLAYSPGVAFACEAIAEDPAEAATLTARSNLIGVVTNGTAVLGLGNIGPLAAKPVMEGKGVLFKKFANIDVFDLEVNEPDADKLIDMIAALEPTFGGINLEDIKAPECFYIEKRLRERMNIPVFHVEAGLRSFRRSQPEEINRRGADHLSALLFCPTPQATHNLAAEGVSRGVMLVGDVMYDAALAAAERPEGADIVPRLGLMPGDYEVATVHRAENTDDDGQLAKVIDFLKARPGQVVLPLHPRTRAALARAGLTLDGITVTDPLGYLEMTHLVKDSSGVLTDSGGLQKEAYFHRVPCITLRDETEWVETVDAGWNRLWQAPETDAPRREITDYGDGNAAGRIAQAAAAYLDEGS